MRSIEDALTATTESHDLDFKESFDPTSKKDWCEIVKDIVAMANTEGGIIIFGLDDYGYQTFIDVSNILTIDPATIVDKIAKYTNIQFCDFSLFPRTKGTMTVAVMQIFKSAVPLVFEKPGTYDIGDGKQARSFSEGSIYFRHGAKSEPGNNQDIQQVVQSNIETARNKILERVSQVVEAPIDHVITIGPPDISDEETTSLPFRLVDDPSAPSMYSTDRDETHPFRMKDIIRRVNAQLPSEVQINQYDILAIRHVYQIENDINLYHNPKFASPQYTEAFVGWIIESYKADQDFFARTRREYKELGLQTFGR